LQFLQFVALLAPVGLLLGILLALARLNRDSEMAALAACGVGPARLLVPIGFLSLIVAIAVAWLSLIEAPAANRAIEEIRRQAQDDMELGALTPGKFTAIDGGATVVHVREAEGDRLRGVFIQRQEDDQLVIVVAEEGERVVNEDTGEIGLRLRNGRRYEGLPGERNFFVAEFGEHGIPVRLESAEFEEAIQSRSSRSLMLADDRASRAELEWRVAAPLSILILAFLAVPLGRSSPREGKYARVGLGLLIYMVYANSLSIVQVWIERGTVPIWLGTWWVHAAIALLAMVMLAQQSGIAVNKQGVRMVRHEPIV
jgi:lipopolysaccharide export system permease protein